MGGDLVQSPSEVLLLLTNQDILEMNSFSVNASELFRSEKAAVWSSEASGEGRRGHGTYVAVFNLDSKPQTVDVTFDQIFGHGHAHVVCNVQELWTGIVLGELKHAIATGSLPRHSTKVFFVTRCTK